jgi:tetratricopeptide (TPR) repeat protein
MQSHTQFPMLYPLRSPAWSATNSLRFQSASLLIAGLLGFTVSLAPALAAAQSSSSSLSSQGAPGKQIYAQEKAPSLIDPAGPTISLISSEPVFVMAAALNACGYDEGLNESDPIRKHIRDEMNQALAQSEDARAKRDALCLYIAQHRMTGGERDIAQYISLSLYLTPPPELEITADLTEMPPDATQVAEVVPILRSFVAAVDLHGIWLASHHLYDDAADKIHDPLSQMIVTNNVYLKMPAATYTGSRFIVVIEPQLSPSTVNARIYGTDYVVVVSPVNGVIPIKDVRHTYLHYVIDPMLYARSNAIDREQPILKEIRDAPLEFRLRSDTVSLTIECLVKAIEARTMDTGVPEYKIPAGVDRSQLPIYEHQRELYQQKVDGARLAQVDHDMRQGYVLTQYFYEELIPFEKDPASLKDNIGEMVYSMDVDQQVHRARQTEFDKQADEDVLQQSKPRQLTGLDLAEAKLSAGDIDSARAMAQKILAGQNDTVASVADAARAHFIIARVDLMAVHANETEDEAEKSVDDAIGEFQKTITTSKDQRLLAWSHIYLGRVLDVECKRDAAVEEYKEALEVRDGQLDTRLAAERGVKAAYLQKGHEHACDDEDTGDNSPGPDAAKPGSQAHDGKPAPQ